MSMTQVSDFNISMKNKMYIFQAKITMTQPNEKAVTEELVIIAITGGNVKRNGIITALSNRCKEISARKDSREKHRRFAGWLLCKSRSIDFKRQLASARRAEKERTGLLVV